MSATPPSPSPAGGDESGTGIEALAARNFQHYRVLRREDGSPWELGRGTMGITYKALDTNLRSEVALKVVNSTLIDHPNARERFVREARAAAALRHRNVASVYHLGNDGEHFFYAMEFIDGETLDALVRRQGPLPVESALQIALQATRALAAAARQNLVHRDIKPANLMVAHEDDDEHMVVKVIDFGLARPTAGDGEDSGAGSLTMHGFVGTPQYASPEQLEERTLDTRSDIYSLGVTLWFLLTGRAPFSGSLAGICNQHLSKPPPWESLPVNVPRLVRQLLAHMLEKHPADRPQNAVELRREIDACLAALPVSAVPAASRAVASAPAAVAPAPLTGDGTVLGGRFTLVYLVGEGSGGRVFEAHDSANGNRTVAVKVLRSGLSGGSQAEQEILRADARQVSVAPHPQLVQLLAFELASPDGRTPAYVAEEWLDGFTWRDLLAARHGALPLAEALRLLGQAATAVDHASSRHLERLELGIHQMHLHFPPDGSGRDFPDRRALLQSPMEEWPEWFVKIEPFGLGRESEESGTWAGEVTLLPGAPAHPAAASPHRAGLPTYLHALARATCELLGGQPPATAAVAGRIVPPKYVSLPTLSEAGNAVLAGTLAGTSKFQSAWEFFEAMTSATGFHAETLTPVAAARSLEVPPPWTPAADPGDETAGAMEQTFPLSADALTATEAVAPPPELPGWEEPAFDHEGQTTLAAPMEDPWQESPLAQLLEEEEAGKLVNPRSSGFALTVGVIVGLMLLLAGFAAVVWQHESQPAPVVKKEHPPVNGKSVASGARPPVAPPARFTPAPTPPPLVAAARQTATVQKVVNPLPTTTPMPMPTRRPQAPPVADDSPANDQPASPVVATEGNRRLPDPTPRFSDKTIGVRLNSEPAGAEVFLQGASLGRTPLKVTLPPGDYQFTARYRDWPEVRQDLHLGEQQSEATAEMRLMSPSQIPLGPRFSPVLENRRRRRLQPRPVAGDGIPVAPAVPLERAVPVARARPVGPADGEEPQVRRALPALEPFVREEKPIAPPSDPAQED